MTRAAGRRRHLRRLAVLAAVVAVVALLFQPVRPHCGLTGYAFGSRLNYNLSIQVLYEMHALADSRGTSFSGIFLYIGQRLFLLPWERYGSLLDDATEVALRRRIEHSRRLLPDSEVTRPWYDLYHSEAHGPSHPETRRAWCRVMKAFATANAPRNSDDR